MIPAFETRQRGAGDQGYFWLLSLRRSLDYRKGSEEEKKKRKQEKKGSVWETLSSAQHHRLRDLGLPRITWPCVARIPFLRHPGHRSDTQREGLGCRTEHCPSWQEDSHAAFLKFVFLAFKTGMLDRLHQKTQLLSGEAWINS